MVWPFTSGYPQHKATDVDGQTFDYIIVGGGTSACVIAARLSEDPSVSVLVISQGKAKDDWLSSIPLMGQARGKDGPQNIVLYSEPDPRWTGQKAFVYTSKALGGATRINGLMLTRGAPANYNRWASLGNHEWSWKKCEPWFKKIENASLCHPASRHRGQDGPLNVLQNTSLLGVDDYWTQTVEDVGIPAMHDANNPKAPAMGYFDIDIMMDRHGYRHSAMTAYLPRGVVAERKGRLTICQGTVATKLEIGEDGVTVAGVHLIDVGSKRSARQCFVRARREVVVCCGTLFTPQLLMLSGIGPEKELEAHRIPVVKNMPGVGANLKDHTSFGISFQVHPEDSYIRLLNPLVAIWHFLLFIFTKTGLFATPTTKNCLWLNTAAIDDETMEIRHTDAENHRNYLDASLPENLPDVEFIMGGFSYDMEYNKSKGYYGYYVTLAQPHSVGRISLASDDPLAAPKLHHPLITDERDWIAARKAARFAIYLTERFRTTEYPFETVWHRAPGMKEGTVEGSWKDPTDEDIDEFVKQRFSSTLHVTSTCRMGREEQGCVVGQDLKVHGFKNLRIGDASVFPALTSAHTVAPTYVVAERCADFIKKTWASRGEAAGEI